MNTALLLFDKLKSTTAKKTIVKRLFLRICTELFSFHAIILSPVIAPWFIFSYVPVCFFGTVIKEPA